MRLSILLTILSLSDAFLLQRQRSPCFIVYAKRKPSTVRDPFGPTPDFIDADIETIDPDEIPELREPASEADLPHPIPHQPWRMGDTAGCEAPIAAEWRQEAEEIIQKAVSVVGGRVLDVTWYLTALVVTLDDSVLEDMPSDMLKASGPVIDVKEKSLPVYSDPDDPNPVDIWESDSPIVWERSPEETAEVEQRESMMYAPRDSDEELEEPHNPNRAPGDEVPLYSPIETRTDAAYQMQLDKMQQFEESEKPMSPAALQIDTAKLSTIAEAILKALEGVEDELEILSRHELILTSPGPNDVLETQRQFDAHRGVQVVVETQDPFESNRVLKGELVDRNSMDIIINKKGRMVTIPLNFVKCVRIPKNKKETALET